MKKLKELLDYIQPTKYIVSSDQYSNEYNVPVLTAGDTFLLGFTNDNDGIYPASKNNPIILFDDFTTAIKWVDFPFKVKSSACKILVPINGANLKYCYYAMRALNFDHTMHKRYWISEYSEQSINDYGQKNQLIVNELDTINSLIDLKKKRLADFDEIIKSRFNELFGDPLLNEKGFPVEKLSVSCPFNVYKGNVEITNGKVWLLNLDMIESNTGAVLSKQYVCLSEVGNSVIKFDKDCVLYSKLRPYLNKVVISDGSGYASSELVYMKTGKRIRKEFLANLLRSKSFVDYIDSKSGGAKMPRASMDFLRSFPLIVPPERLQEQFATFVNQIDKSKFVVQQQIKDLKELLDKKMDEYFGG